MARRISGDGFVTVSDLRSIMAFSLSKTLRVDQAYREIHRTEESPYLRAIAVVLHQPELSRVTRNKELPPGNRIQGLEHITVQPYVACVHQNVPPGGRSGSADFRR